jgi:hypothetical protein
MLQTFKALLVGNRLEWVDEAPNLSDRPIQVHVTLLEPDSDSKTNVGSQVMAEILTRLAEINACAEVNDPVEWQREVRRDRQIPNRDE